MNNMIRTFVCCLGFLAVSALSSGCAAVSPAAEAMVGQEAPTGRLMLLSGDDVAIRPDDGRMKVMLFWATWCPYSKDAIADFEELARRYQARRDVAFYAVSIDRNDELYILEERIQEQNLRTVQHVFSGNDVQDEAFLALHGNTIPYAVVVDGDGVVRFVDIGVSGLSSYLRRTIGR